MKLCGAKNLIVFKQAHHVICIFDIVYTLDRWKLVFRGGGGIPGLPPLHMKHWYIHVCDPMKTFFTLGREGGREGGRKGEEGRGSELCLCTCPWQRTEGSKFVVL